MRVNNTINESIPPRTRKNKKYLLVAVDTVATRAYCVRYDLEKLKVRSMICPHCQHRLTVTNSRPSDGGSATTRRYQCGKCDEIMWTVERLDETLYLHQLEGKIKRLEASHNILIKIKALTGELK